MMKLFDVVSAGVAASVLMIVGGACGPQSQSSSSAPQCQYSSDCGLGHFCDSGMCKIGCREDSDCSPPDPVYGRYQQVCGGSNSCTGNPDLCFHVKYQTPGENCSNPISILGTGSYYYSGDAVVYRVQMVAGQSAIMTTPDSANRIALYLGATGCVNGDVVQISAGTRPSTLSWSATKADSFYIKRDSSWDCKEMAVTIK